MPDPWTFGGSLAWLLMIGFGVWCFAMFLGYAGKWIGI